MIDQYPPANGVLTSLIWRKTAAGGETSLSGYDNASQALSYTPGQEQVYLNGILLVRGSDYTATNGTSITGLAALAADDFVQINCYNNFSVASVPTTSLTGTVSNAQLANSSITINGTSTSLGGSYTNASASTSTAGIVQLTDSTSSTSTTTAATPNAVKSAYDLANGAIQKTLTTTTGDIIYASSANTPARLGIGSTNQVLTVSGGIPSWASPASGSMTLLSTTTYTGSAISLTSISQSYKSLYIVMDNCATTGFRFNNHTGTNYLSLMASSRASAQGEAVITRYVSGNLDQIIFGYFPTTNNVGAQQIIEIPNYSSTTCKKMARSMYTGYHDSNFWIIEQDWGVKTDNNDAVTSIQLTTGRPQGTVYLYGVN